MIGTSPDIHLTHTGDVAAHGAARGMTLGGGGGGATLKPQSALLTVRVRRSGEIKAGGGLKRCHNTADIQIFIPPVNRTKRSGLGTINRPRSLFS